MARDWASLVPSGYRVTLFDEIDSTNEEAKRRAEAGERMPHWLIARRQTAGRGRHGRSWSSLEGNLSATLLLPSVETARAGELAFVAGLALVEAMEACAMAITRTPEKDKSGLVHGRLAGKVEKDKSGLVHGRLADKELVRGRLTLKWPNDVLLNNKKLCGILLEAGAPNADGQGWLAIGMGANLAHYPEGTDWPATSLATLGEPPALEDALRALAQAWDEQHAFWRAEGFAAIRDAWLQRAAGVGQPVRVRVGETTLSGRFEGLDSNGAMMLATEKGYRRLLVGDMFFQDLL